jgi:carboxypeptidase family protein
MAGAIYLNPSACCGCGGCDTKICVQGTCSANVQGASVAVKSGSTVVASGTTGSDGCVTLTIGSAGTYTVVVSAAGYVTSTTSHYLACGGTTNIALTKDTIHVTCCATCPNPLPMTIHISDAAGTWTAAWTGGGWQASNSYGTSPHKSISPVCAPDGNCMTSGGTADYPYTYNVSCTGTPGVFHVIRSWAYVDCTPNPAGIQYYTGSGCAFGTANGAEAIGDGTLDCDTMAGSISLSTVGSPLLPDPVGGAVTISS